MSFLKYTINGYEFTFSYGDGIILDPKKINPDDPKFIEALKVACGISPIADRLIILGEWATHQNFGLPVSRMDDNDISSILINYDTVKSHNSVTIPDDVTIFVEQVQSEQNRREMKLGEKRLKELRRKEKSDGYVYLIQSPTGSYKIGRTVNPDNRIKTFNVKLPFEVSYVVIIKTDDMYTLESELHNRFDQNRVNGEWFNLTPADVEYIKGLAS